MCRGTAGGDRKSKGRPNFDEDDHFHDDNFVPQHQHIWTTLPSTEIACKLSRQVQRRTTSGDKKSMCRRTKGSRGTDTPFQMSRSFISSGSRQIRSWFSTMSEGAVPCDCFPQWLVQSKSERCLMGLQRCTGRTGLRGGHDGPEVAN